MVVVLVVLVVLSEARSTCGAVFSRSASFALFWSVGIEVTMMVADQGAPSLHFLAAVYIYSTTISLIHQDDPLAIINNKIYVANI